MRSRTRGIILICALGAILLYGTGIGTLFGQTAPSQGPTSSAVTTVPGQIAPPAPGVPAQPAIAVTTVPSPAAPQNATDQVIWAGAAAYILRYLTKKPWFPLLTEKSSSTLKAQVGFVVALLTAAGVHMAVNGSFFSDAGVGFTMTGLSAHAVKDVGFQWLAQQTWYDVVVKKLTSGTIINNGGVA